VFVFWGKGGLQSCLQGKKKEGVKVQRVIFGKYGLKSLSYEEK